MTIQSMCVGEGKQLKKGNCIENSDFAELLQSNKYFLLKESSPIKGFFNALSDSFKQGTY